MSRIDTIKRVDRDKKREKALAAKRHERERIEECIAVVYDGMRDDDERRYAQRMVDLVREQGEA